MATGLEALGKTAASPDPVVGRGRVPGDIRLLARQGGPHQVPDPLVAATAQLADVTVWHYDEGYEPISAFTGQPTQ